MKEAVKCLYLDYNMFSERSDQGLGLQINQLAETFYVTRHCYGIDCDSYVCNNVHCLSLTN